MDSLDALGRPGGPSETPAQRWAVALGGAPPSGTITLIDGSIEGVHSSGVDLVDVARFRRAVARSGEPFVRRVFDERERAEVSRDPDQRIVELAALFGVKESVVKAVGGMPLGGRYADISVQVEPSGAACAVRLRGELGKWARRHGVELVGGSAPAGDGLLLAWVLALTTTAPSGPTPAGPTPAGPAQSELVESGPVRSEPVRSKSVQSELAPAVEAQS